MPAQPNSESEGGVSRREFIRTAALGSIIGLASLDALADDVAPPRLPDPAGSRGHDWPAIRKHFLLPSQLVYLNNGSLGPCPRYVLQVVADTWNALESNPAAEGYGPLITAMEQARAKAAAFLGCRLDEIAFTRNTTEAMNTVAQGIHLSKGDRVLTTDHEHPGGSVCWEYYARRFGVTIDKVRLPVPPMNEKEVLKLFQQALTPRTKVLSISHVTFSAGLRLPVRKIAEIAHLHDALLVVDGAQAPGVLVVNVDELDCDAYATSGHKWMLAPKGPGLLYFNGRAKQRIDPLLLHHGFRSYTAATGTRNIPGIVGFGAAIDFLNRIGIRRVQKRALELRGLLLDGLKQLKRIGIASPMEPALGSALTTIELPAGISNAKLAQSLRKKHNVIVKVVPRRLLNGIRVSCHIYNSEQDMEKFLSTLKAELG